MTFEAQTSVSPELSVRRGRDAVEFYKAAFGARELYRVGGTDEHTGSCSDGSKTRSGIIGRSGSRFAAGRLQRRR